MFKTKKDCACFETTKRLLASLVNEGLVEAVIELTDGGAQPYLSLRGLEQVRSDIKQVQIFFGPNAALCRTSIPINHFLRPEDLLPPVKLCHNNGAQYEELDPGLIFQALYPWFQQYDKMNQKERIIQELQNSAANQEKWLEIGEGLKEPDLASSAVEWERTLIWGHSTHPMHRTLFAEPPLNQVQPGDIPSMLNPELTFLSLPKRDMKISGPFTETLLPLLEKLGVPSPTPNHIIIPCLSQQLPSIFQRFPNAVPVYSARCAKALCNFRTIKLNSELQFPYRIKLSLACYMTSALRTITPWTACAGREISDLLCKLVPEDLWVFREVAAVVGSQDDFEEAKHLACILREDLEIRARERGETLIVATALSQKSLADERSYAERLFGLDTVEKKKLWFKNYTSCLLNLVLPPLLKHGICLEAHGQNIVARFCIKTKNLKGFGIYDFGGIRLHIPTLRSQGHDMNFIRPDHYIACNELQEAWGKIHHPLFQSHLGQLISALNLESEGGWGIVRDSIREVLKPDEDPNGKLFCEFLLAEQMAVKCFLRMKMEDKYRVRVERKISNVLLT